MFQNGSIWVGTGDGAARICLLPSMANRHGLIAGATGTGKTVTLKVLAEGFSDMGVPVFVGDIKGDLSGLSQPGTPGDAITKRLASVGAEAFSFRDYPTVFWDIYGEQGHPVRATVSEMGPVLLSRLLDLNETQAGVLSLIFRVADDEGMLLLDIKDVKAMLAYVGENAGHYALNYGNVSKASIGAIQRAIGVLEDQGGERFFGEPALNIADWMRQDETGRGQINILACDKLFLSPLMYSTFLLWMLSELYETLPEQGDMDKPKMVFFFDEAHLLFDNCDKQVLEKVEQVVRLIRSKGVGVYFITQSPADIPMSVLGQLGNRVQHALRAYTPLDQKAVRVAAQTFRTNPAFDTEEAITQLQTGEALLSFLDETGAPGVVSRAVILPPQSFMGAIDESQRTEVIQDSPFYGVYEQEIDRSSAYEYLAGKMVQAAAPVAVQPAAAPVAAQPAAAPVAAGGVAQVPGAAVTPAAPAAVPAAGLQPVRQTVLVYDPTTGAYVQQEMTLAYNPSTQQYVPAAQPATPAMSEKERKEAEKAEKEARKAEKERLAEERRKRADELREERAARARANNSVLGRVRNTAIATVTRTVTQELTRGLLGTLTGRRR